MLKSLPLTKILLTVAAVSVVTVAAVGGTFANFTTTPLQRVRIGFALDDPLGLGRHLQRLRDEDR